MASNSKHYGDVFNWIKRVVDSSITIDQIQSANKLIENFERYCDNYISKSEYYKMSRELQSHSDTKWEAILMSNIK
jgi:hypothetical protein